MTVGPGQYDAMAECILQTLQAQGVVLIVFDGLRGNGASIKVTQELALIMPGLLRAMADDQEKDNKKTGLTR